jgi:phosphoribosylglycinamide formyltransferase 1
MAALLAASKSPAYGGRVVAVISDTPAAAGLTIARDAGVPVEVLQLHSFESREEWNRALSGAVEAYTPDLIVLAGFMKILGEETVSRFRAKIINTHPALLPSFPGAHAVRDALAHGVKVTGCTVHFVDAGVDTGPIIAQSPVMIAENDTEETLHERIKVVERELVVDTVRALVTRGWVIEGRTVRFGQAEGKAS